MLLSYPYGISSQCLYTYYVIPIQKRQQRTSTRKIYSLLPDRLEMHASLLLDLLLLVLLLPAAKEAAHTRRRRTSVGRRS